MSEKKNKQEMGMKQPTWLMRGKRMRYITVFSTVIIAFGVILVSGSLFIVPYTVREPIRVDRAKTWVHEAFVLAAFESKTYLLDSVVKNTSIVQVDVESYNFVVLKIMSDDAGELYLERRGRGDWTSFWTLPQLGYDIWRFVLENPYDLPVNVTAKITEFFLKVTEYRNVTYYRPLLSPIYGYSGIIAIIIATSLNVFRASRESKRQEQNKTLDSETA